jgi:hypothetical protein
MSGQTQGGSRSDTLTTDQSGGLGQASSGQSSSQGEGFIGSREGGSDSATGGTDFAKQGRGALEDEDEVSGKGSSGSDFGSSSGGSDI